MNRLPFTKYASKALNEGREIAGHLGFKDVSSIFVLLGLYGADGSLASEVLKMHGVTRELIEEAIKEKSKMPKDRRRTVMDTPKTEYLLEIAGELAMKYGCEAIGSEHILMAMIKDGDNEAFRFLEDHKISSEGIYTDILVTAGIDFRSAKNEYNEAISDGGDMEDGAGEYMLLQYSTDLTEKAMLGKLDPMIGRESEMERLMQILCRRTKNNPCLIGDPGVGKTAIVEGLAQRIAEGNMPRILKNKRILSLDLTKVIAGTKFRGEFEERMKRIVTEATQDDSIILFIDEIHTIIGAGGSEGAMDASNILKPALARGDFQLICNLLCDRHDLILIHLMDLCYLFIRLRDRIDDLIEIKGYLLTVSLDNLCFYITIHSFSLIYIKLQDSVYFHFLAQNLVVILPISTISCAIAFIILHSFS